MGGEMSEPISGISEVQSLRISFYPTGIEIVE